MEVGRAHAKNSEVQMDERSNKLVSYGYEKTMEGLL